jgi:hypothetical protein
MNPEKTPSPAWVKAKVKAIAIAHVKIEIK